MSPPSALTTPVTPPPPRPALVDLLLGTGTVATTASSHEIEISGCANVVVAPFGHRP